MNKLYKALVYDREVSLSVLETTDMVNDAIKIHNLDAQSAVTLGGLLTCAAYMAGCLKSEKGAVSLTVKAGGDAGTVSVSGNQKGHIRGYIDGSCHGKLNGGYLTVVKEDGLFRPFVGTCELRGNDVSQNLMQYFQMSEQIDTAVAIGVKMDGNRCVAAGGVVMQLLPGTSEENMDRAEERMQALVNPAEVVAKFGADGILNEFFPDLAENGATYLTFPEYKCNCSREKTADIVRSLGRQEALDIINETGSIKVHCHYCNTDHEFTLEDIDKLF